MLQAAWICFSEIINGGEIRRQLEANKNQSVRTPFAILASIIFLLASNESNSIASHKPNERTDFILGCTNNDLNNSSFLFTSFNIPSSSSACMAARPAAQQTG